MIFTVNFDCVYVVFIAVKPSQCFKFWKFFFYSTLRYFNFISRALFYLFRHCLILLSLLTISFCFFWFILFNWIISFCFFWLNFFISICNSRINKLFNCLVCFRSTFDFSRFCSTSGWLRWLRYKNIVAFNTKLVTGVFFYVILHFCNTS